MTRLANLRAWLASATLLVLTACGGGHPAGGGIVGTGDAPLFVTGVLSTTAPASVTVGGQAMDTRQATVTVDGQASNVAALKVGMVVDAEATLQQPAVVARRIDYRAALRGTVDGVDSAIRAFTILGQQVRTDATTVFEGGTFDTLRNQSVEVSGLRGAGGVLLATRVEIRAVPGTQVTQVAGTASGLDAVARTFRVGSLLVDYAGTAAPAGLRDGAAVLASGTGSATGDRLLATAVTVGASPGGVDGSSVEVEGLVERFVTLASFVVAGRTIDASSATIDGGPAGAVVDGARVEVEGRLRGGVVVATRVEIEDVPTVGIVGLVDAVSPGIGSFVVGGQSLVAAAGTQYVDASSAPVSGFGLASIAVGDRLAVRAQRHATGLVATHVERRDRAAPPPETPLRVEGTVTGFVSTAEFLVGTQRVNAASARFENGTAADLRDGARLTVEGIANGVLLLATRVAFAVDTTPPAVAVEIEGPISGFASIARFRVAGQVVDASSARFQNGSAADLADGRVVTVRGTLANGVVAAASVEFHASAPPTATTVELEGPITDFVSAADFRVEGQRVDATAARFSGGSAASLANGRRVHVKGPVAGGFVRAETVAVEDDTAGVEAHAEGRITAFVSVANFTVAARVVDAGDATFEHGTAADLRVGRNVHVEGRLVGTVLRAAKVAFE